MEGETQAGGPSARGMDRPLESGLDAHNSARPCRNGALNAACPCAHNFTQHTSEMSCPGVVRAVRLRCVAPPRHRTAT